MSLKSFFFREEEEIVVPKKENPPSPSPVVMPTATQPVTTISGTDYIKYLQTRLKENNQPGPDFLEFSEALKALDKVPLSEEQKYQVTFPTYLSMGISADKLCVSAEQYLKVLDVEHSDFYKELEITNKKEIFDKQNEIKKLQDKNTELTKQIQENTLKIQNMTSEVNNASSSLSAEKNAFENAFTSTKLKIQDQISKIKTYLNANTPK